MFNNGLLHAYLHFLQYYYYNICNYVKVVVFFAVLLTLYILSLKTSCLPPSVPDSEQKLQFSLGCQVVLPPESFLTLKLPFVYGVQLEDGKKHPLNPFEQQPEMTAWVTKGSILQILSKGSNDEEYQTH